MAIITEDYVSFEIAKLLKEKGFMEGAIIKFFASGYDSKGNILDIRDTELKDYPRPTLQMAMKWLREEHNLSIDVATYTSGFSACVWSMKRCNVVATENLIEQYGGVTFSLFHTYEEAVEVSLKYCLENLI